MANEMRKAGFTPGPWTYEVQDRDRHILARNGESLQCDCRYYPWVSANEADWHLIAASPDLYEALQSFVYEFGDKTNSATVNKARAALSKARGETQ